MKRITLFVLLVFAWTTGLIQLNCGAAADWRELNTRNRSNQDAEIYAEYAVSDSAEIIDALNLSQSNIPVEMGIDIEYLAVLVIRISDLEEVRINRDNKAKGVEKLGSQKGLHEQILAELTLLDFQIVNAKRLYNAASVSINAGALEAAGLPKIYILK